MPKNKIGGKGHKKAKRRDNNREIDFDEDDSLMFYAQTLKKLGNNRFLVKRHDSQEQQVTIPGRMCNKVWINPGDFLIIREDEVLCKVMSDKGRSQATQYFNSQANEEGNTGVIFGDGGEDSDEEEDDEMDIRKLCLGSKAKKSAPSKAAASASSGSATPASDEESGDGSLDIDDI